MLKIYLALLFLMLSLSLQAQKNPFNTRWQEIDTLEVDGKIATALEKTNVLLKKATRNADYDNIIKATIFRWKFLQIIKEGSDLSIIKEVDQVSAELPFLYSSALQIYKAKFLKDYYDANRWQITIRKPVDNEDNAPMDTWSVDQLLGEIRGAYSSAFSDFPIDKEGQPELSEIPVDTLSGLLNIAPLNRKYRPSLYDLFAQEAIAFYKEDFEGVTRPEEIFAPTAKELLAPSIHFREIKFKTADSLYSKAKVLIIYQNLERLHSNDRDPEAFVYTLLQRLDFAKDFFDDGESWSLYLQRMNEQLAAYEGFEVNGLIKYHLAMAYRDRADAKDENDKLKFPEYNLKSAALTEEIIAAYPNTDIAQRAALLLQAIKQVSIDAKMESYSAPQQASLLSVKYKNADSLTIKIARVAYNFETDGYQSRNKDSLVNGIIKNHAFFTKKVNLPNADDHNQHSTEFALPPLEIGTYLVYAETEKGGDDGFTYGVVHVSDLSLNSIDHTSFTRLQVLDRKTGKPIGGVKAVFRNYKDKVTNRATSDNNGQIKLSKSSKTASQTISLVKNGDTLKTNYWNGWYRKEQENTLRARTMIFLDRAIYRPGQKVYFKAILLKYEDKKTEVVAGEYINLIVTDANGEKITDFKLKTNSFGSVFGEFILPKTGLTGSYTIHTDEENTKKSSPFWQHVKDTKIYYYNQTRFQVEEYKRPTFEIVFDKNEKAYKLGDTVSITGKAASFMGAPLAQTPVRYEVSRSTYTHAWWRRSESDVRQIAQDTVITDAEGKFEIRFVAAPGSTKSDLEDLIFKFTATATITDVNGETREASTVLKMGEKNLIASLILPQQLEKGDTLKPSIKTQNLNDVPVKSTGSLHIYKRIAPDRILTSRTLPVPEIQQIPKDEFVKLFPNMPYKDENDPNNWAKGKLVFDAEFTIDGTYEPKIPTDASWPSGVYSAVLVVKSNGVTDTLSQQFTLTDVNNKYLADNQIFAHSVLNNDFRKDGFVEINLQTAPSDLFINVSGYDGDTRFFSEDIILDGNRTLKIPLDGKASENLQLHIYGIKNGETIDQSISITLKSEQKQFAFETKTFRNKLEPGAKETWSFSIKSETDQAEKMEVLASMYDASLDQFVPQRWDSDPQFVNKNPNFPGYQTYTLDVLENFHNAFYYPSIKLGYLQHFDQLNLFGFTFGQINSNRYQLYLARLKNQRGLSNQLSGNIRGRVTDLDGNPLPGVNISVKGRKTNTASNFDGEFGIDAQKGDVLLFNSLGFKNTQHEIGDKTELFIILEEDPNSMDEVIVVGYGVQEEAEEASAPMMKVNNSAAERVMAGSESITIRGLSSVSGEIPLYVIDGKISENVSLDNLNPADIVSIETLKSEEATALYGARGSNGVFIITTKKGLKSLMQVEARKNLDETAFFFPQLTTDKNGDISFDFTSPEALTRWKFNMLAHNTAFETARFSEEVITQKELSITPNAPRFLREGDSIQFQAKVNNLTDAPMTGMAILQLYDALSMRPIDSLLMTGSTTQNFNIKTQNSSVLKWSLFIPKEVQAVTYRILAKAGNFSDGEENTLPVLTNRMLVTETLPIFVRAGESKTVTFNNLANNSSNTLTNHQFTLEYTSNPAWYAIQSLPYLMEFPYECSEQIFARLYANSLGAKIINSQPKIKEVFQSWKAKDSLRSNLEKNQELKSLMITETPWLRDAASETEQKNRIALLFDLEKLAGQEQETLAKLKQMQNSSGAFPWFSGGRDNDYITRHILAGLGHLKKLGVKVDMGDIVPKAVDYLDTEIIDMYKTHLDKVNPENKLYERSSYLHYLYARSFFLKENPLPKALKPIVDTIIKQNTKNWNSLPLYEKTLLALTLQRTEDSAGAKKIMESLRESAVHSDDNGMYWKSNQNSWLWYQAPIETQALIIEAFTEIMDDPKTVEELKIWLVQNKRTNSWPTTKATTEACYALLMQGQDWLALSDNTKIKVGGETIKTKKMAETEKEAGTGYLKLNWNASEITPAFADIEVINKNQTAGYGGAYWQYFEDLDKIKTHGGSPLSVQKKLYLNINSGSGKTLKSITSESPIKIGELITVRLIVKTNAGMEYIHLKDMRASGFEPTNVLSEYKYQDGTAYYESTRDAATHFFFDQLKTGTYVLEYTVRANNAGNFSNGITTIESMYAPEFAGHTEGIRVGIESESP